MLAKAGRKRRCSGILEWVVSLEGTAAAYLVGVDLGSEARSVVFGFVRHRSGTGHGETQGWRRIGADSRSGAGMTGEQGREGRGKGWNDGTGGGSAAAAPPGLGLS